MPVFVDFPKYGELPSPLNLKEAFAQPFTRYPKEDIKDIKERLGRFKEKFSTMLVCGMGGSSLGAKTAYSFLRETTKGQHRLLFLDNLDPLFVKKRLEELNWEDTLFCFISKSGTTLETVVFLNLILEELKRRNLKVEERVIFVGDRGKSFENLANSLGCEFFEIPSDVDGRFSVLTSSQLVPIYFADIDIKELWEGALELLRDPTEDSPAVKLAKFKMYHYLNGGRNIAVMFTYGNYIYPFAFWYSQLWAESLGKNSRGQTPIKALGTVDQHSLVQLFREGPDDKVYQFIKVANNPESPKLSDNPVILDYIAGKSVSQIFNALYEGTKTALIETGRPIVTLELDSYTAFNLGYLFMLYMVTTVVAAQILDTNPFGQPGVELGKEIAKEKLKESEFAKRRKAERTGKRSYR
ncbi:MAG TPA: glucose-6-phosphate isomerase [Aquifex sp.]|uniref:Glucose-6-phosphate isomerase n=1 Tax=Aquifex aeolicus TaxID=63363 RepID=A0A9D1CFB0_AQUAO|nr:glucose-6-phosphate isomerase [Aquifex sp.]HIP97957.1 glucose-6-phosphate isomerase [Aquifex aeolicus]